MSLVTWAAAALITCGAFFFLAGTVGLLRFPDLFTRLHALTKADNLGLGLIVAGLALEAQSWGAVLRLLLIWVLALLTSATLAQLIAAAALREGLRPWTRRR